MRYFKYNHPKKTEKEIYKAELAAFGEKERRLLRKEKACGITAAVIAWAVGIAVFIFINYLSALLCTAQEAFIAEADSVIIKILFFLIIGIVMIALFFVSIIVAGIAAGFSALPLWNMESKAHKQLKSIRREHLHEISSKACEHIVEFYGLREPSITTKCYDSTDVKFKNKDIVIFECGGEIRIIRSFFGSVNLSENDFGCYAFKNREFSVSYTEYKGKRAALLDLGEVKLTLAARAKPFIEKLAKYEENGIFLPASKKKKGSSAYYELSFCKKNLPIEELTKNGYTYWSEDSLLFYIDDDARFFEHYMKYFEKPHTPDGSGRFFYAGINYYTAEETEKMLSRIKKDAPPYSAPLIEWLTEARAYNGFFFLGI
jgi:hypothetical protein